MEEQAALFANDQGRSDKKYEAMEEQAALFVYDQGRSDKRYEVVKEQTERFACNQRAQTVPQGVFEKCLS